MKTRLVASRLLLAAGSVLLASCASTDTSGYANEKPALDVQHYFLGKLDAWGMFQDRSTHVQKRFHVIIDCHWQDIDGVPTGTLDEQFTYADGTTQRRVWTLKRVAPDHFIGTAADVVGEAQGVVSGNTLHWNYTLALPVDGHVYDVQFDDLMVLMDDRIMLNHARMSKFGVTLGDVTLAFTRG